MIQSGKYSKRYFKGTRLVEGHHTVGNSSITRRLAKLDLKKWPEDTVAEFGDFLAKMLEFDPKKRASALDSLQHPFLAKTATTTTNYEDWSDAITRGFYWTEEE